MAKKPIQPAKKTAKKSARRRVNVRVKNEREQAATTTPCYTCYESGYLAGVISAKNNLTQLKELRSELRRQEAERDDRCKLWEESVRKINSTLVKLEAVTLLIKGEVNV